jgi:4-aminobutyrate aminotransferase-like enzyme
LDEVVKCLAALTISGQELNQGLDILADAVRSAFSEVAKEAA